MAKNYDGLSFPLNNGRDLQIKSQQLNQFPLLSFETNFVNKAKKDDIFFAHFLHIQKLITDIRELHKNNYYDNNINNVSNDKKKFPFFYKSSQLKLNEKPKFPYEQIYFEKVEEETHEKKICNRFPLNVHILQEQKFPFNIQIYEMNIKGNSKIYKNAKKINFNIVTKTHFNSIKHNNKIKIKKLFEKNSKDKLMTPLIRRRRKREQDQVENWCEKTSNENEKQKFNEQQKKIPNQQQKQHELFAINKNIIEEMLEAALFCENGQQKKFIVDKSPTQQMMTTPIIPTTIKDDFKNNRILEQTEKLNESNIEKRNFHMKCRKNNNENIANIQQDTKTIKSCYLINKQITKNNVLENLFQFENIHNKFSDVCEQSTTQEARGITIHEQLQKSEEENSKLYTNDVMGLTNITNQGSDLSEQQIEVAGNVDMKHEKNMPEQKLKYDDLNKSSSFTTYPRATIGDSRKYMEKSIDENVSKTSPRSPSIRNSTRSLDVTSVLPERTLLRRQRRSSTLRQKSNEDPVERLNRLRARISGALCQVKGVLQQYSTDNVEEEETAAKSSNDSSDFKQEEETAGSNETELEKSTDKIEENGPISFRFVKKIRRRSLFDERDATLLEQKKLSEHLENETKIIEQNVELKHETTINNDKVPKDDAVKKLEGETVDLETQEVEFETIKELEVKPAEIKDEKADKEIKVKKLEVETVYLETQKVKGLELKPADIKDEKADKKLEVETVDLETLKVKGLEGKSAEIKNGKADKEVKADINIEIKDKSLKEAEIETIVIGNETKQEQNKNEIDINENTLKSEEKLNTPKSKVKKKYIYVVKSKQKSSATRRASVAAVELAKIEQHAENITPLVSSVKVQRRPSDSETIIRKNTTNLNLNLGDTEKLLKIGGETRGNETQQLYDDKKKQKKLNDDENCILQVHSKVKQKAHATPLAKTNEYVVDATASDIDIIINNNNQQNNNKNVKEENILQCNTDCNKKAIITEPQQKQKQQQQLVHHQIDEIDIEKEQRKVTDCRASLQDQDKVATTTTTTIIDEATLLSATAKIASDSSTCNSLSESLEHFRTPEISCAANIAMPELQSLPARVLLTASVEGTVVPEEPPFNELILITNSKLKETVNAETQTPNLLLQVKTPTITTTTENNVESESVRSKPARKVKKKVIIKRQQRRLSVSDTGFFREPVSEDQSQANGAAVDVDVETLEKPISYETDDENFEQKTGIDEQLDEPVEVQEPEPLKSCMKDREFHVGDWVMYAERYKKTMVRWKKGLVIERITSISYKLDIDGKEVPAHISYIKKYTDRKVNFGGKEYLEINYEQIEEEEEKARRYSIWNLV